MTKPKSKIKAAARSTVRKTSKPKSGVRSAPTSVVTTGAMSDFRPIRRFRET